MRDFDLAYVRFGSGADITRSPSHVRFTPESGHRATRLTCPLCAKSEHMQCSNGLLLNHPVGELLELQRNLEAERLGNLEVQEQLNFRSLLDRRGLTPAR